MPVSYQIDTASRVVFTRGTGRITDDDVLAYQDRLRSDPAFNPAFDQIYDLSEVIESVVSDATLRRLGERNPFLPSVRRAFITTIESSHRHVETFLSMADLDSEQVRIFSDMAAARRWLYLPQA